MIGEMRTVAVASVESVGLVPGEMRAGRSASQDQGTGVRCTGGEKGLAPSRRRVAACAPFSDLVLLMLVGFGGHAMVIGSPRPMQF